MSNFIDKSANLGQSFAMKNIAQFLCWLAATRVRMPKQDNKSDWAQFFCARSKVPSGFGNSAALVTASRSSIYKIVLREQERKAKVIVKTNEHISAKE
jgi:hypothetical protein